MSRSHQLATVTRNFTICISAGIRENFPLKPKEKVLLDVQNGKLIVRKVPSTLEELAGHGKEAFKKLGGGEHYIQQEKKAWGK